MTACVMLAREPCRRFSCRLILRMRAELSLDTSVAVFTYSVVSKPKYVRPKAGEVAEHLQGDTEGPALRVSAKCGRELVGHVLRAHDLAEDGAALLAERDGDALAVGALFVEHHVRGEHAHLAQVNLVNQGIEGEVQPFALHLWCLRARSGSMARCLRACW